jgi:hypothetical protein
MQACCADDRADGVHAGAAVLADRGEEAKAKAVLVELRAAGGGERGLLLRELRPSEHSLTLSGGTDILPPAGDW